VKRSVEIPLVLVLAVVITWVVLFVKAVAA
jgi:hypothetical protein